VKQVFLSYARADGKKAKRLYDELCRSASVRIWFDRIDLRPGVKWEPAIRKAIRESDCFLALLSNQSVTTRGVRHSELREALAWRPAVLSKI
jgi:TIR domain